MVDFDAFWYFYIFGVTKSFISYNAQCYVMSMLRIDMSAHIILKRVRDDMKSCGIDGATLSDAVRRLDEGQRREVHDGMDG